MSKTKIVVLRMKEVVYTAVFVGIGVLLLIVLFFMFGRQNSPKSESTQSTINNESRTYKNDAMKNCSPKRDFMQIFMRASL